MPVSTPLGQAIERLTYEMAYLRDVLFLAGPGGVCRVSAPAMQNVYEGLAWVLTTLRQQAPPPPAGVGGTPVQPAAGDHDMLRSLQALLVHGHNQQQAMQRAAVAQAQGLDPATYGAPFPGAQVTTTTTTNNTGGGLLKGALLAAALTTAGGAATWGLLQGSTPAVPVVKTKVSVAQPAVPGSAAASWDAIYETQIPDGTWVQTKRERLQP